MRSPTPDDVIALQCRHALAHFPPHCPSSQINCDCDGDGETEEERILKVWMNSVTSLPVESNALVMNKMKRRLLAGGPTATVAQHRAEIEKRLKSGQLTVSGAEDTLRGVQQQASLHRALSAYNPLWLTAAVDVLFHSHHPSISQESVHTIINTHILADPVLLECYKGVKTAGYWTHLGVTVTTRLLLLIALLDAVFLTQNTITLPLLFLPHGNHGIRSSEQVLQCVVGPLMKEADVVRRLHRIGYSLSYAQTPQQGIEFSVRNIRVDLRDGLRLCRAMDVVAGGWGVGGQRSLEPSLCAQARYPAVRRPDRIHNVQLALQAIGYQDDSTTLATVGRVVNGDAATTLDVVWRIVLEQYVPKHVVVVSDLVIEIKRLQSNHQQQHVLPCSAVLLQWMSIVSRMHVPRQQVEVTNFTSDLEDGRVFCALIHHYMGASVMPSPATTTASDMRYTAIRSALSKMNLGIDFSARNVSSERMGMLFSALLCRTLLRSTRELRAAIAIQRAWRAYVNPISTSAVTLTPGEHLRRYVHAAGVVQRWWRRHRLVTGLHQFSEDRKRLERAMTRLQAMWKGRRERARFMAKKEAAVVVQGAWRGVFVRKYIVHDRIMVPCILATGLERYVVLVEGTRHRAATVIQSVWRGVLARRHCAQCQRYHKAATVIQTYTRGFLARNHAKRRREAIVAIQRAYRRRRAGLRRQRIEQTKRRMMELAATMAQFAVRTAAAKRIQHAFRQYMQRRVWATATTTTIPSLVSGSPSLLPLPRFLSPPPPRPIPSSQSIDPRTTINTPKHVNNRTPLRNIQNTNTISHSSLL